MCVKLSVERTRRVEPAMCTGLVIWTLKEALHVVGQHSNSSTGRQAGRLRERCSGHGRPAVAASQWSVTVMHAGAVHGARLRAAAVIVFQCRTSAAHTTGKQMHAVTDQLLSCKIFSGAMVGQVRQVHQGCCKSLTPCQEGSRDNPSLPPSTSTRWLSVWT